MGETFFLRGLVSGEPDEAEMGAGEVLDYQASLRAQQAGGTGSLAEIYVDDLEDLPPPP